MLLKWSRKLSPTPVRHLVKSPCINRSSYQNSFWRSHSCQVSWQESCQCYSRALLNIQYVWGNCFYKSYSPMKIHSMRKFLVIINSWLKLELFLKAIQETSVKVEKWKKTFLGSLPHWQDKSQNGSKKIAASLCIHKVISDDFC